jgi:hypothetical protein
MEGQPTVKRYQVFCYCFDCGFGTLQKSSLEGTATSDKKITTSLKVGVGDG